MVLLESMLVYSLLLEILAVLKFYFTSSDSTDLRAFKNLKEMEYRYIQRNHHFTKKFVIIIC